MRTLPALRLPVQNAQCPRPGQRPVAGRDSHRVADRALPPSGTAPQPNSRASPEQGRARRRDVLRALPGRTVEHRSQALSTEVPREKHGTMPLRLARLAAANYGPWSPRTQGAMRFQAEKGSRGGGSPPGIWKMRNEGLLAPWYGPGWPRLGALPRERPELGRPSCWKSSRGYPWRGLRETKEERPVEMHSTGSLKHKAGRKERDPAVVSTGTRVERSAATRGRVRSRCSRDSAHPCPCGRERKKAGADAPSTRARRRCRFDSACSKLGMTRVGAAR